MAGDPLLLRFGPYELDEACHELRRCGVRVRIQARPLALLCYLVRHAHRVVSHREILEQVWPGVRVEPGALKSAVHALRRALGGGDGDWIASIHGQGYRFTGTLRREPRAPASPALSSDFVGRGSELTALRELCRLALRGERQIALIGGPPAVGKTRTAMELAREAEPLGFETYVGRTHVGSGAPALWPWAQIVRGWTLVHGQERLEAIAGANAVELLGLAAPAAEAPSCSSPARFRAFERASRFLARASSERPLLLILDDLHRADADSLELLAFLAQHLLAAPLLVLATHRPVDADHPLGRVLLRPGTRSVPLRALDRRAVGQVVAQTLDAEPAPGLVEAVLLRSGGNPLFVSELARSLAARMPLDSALPARVHDAVRARLCECSPASLRILCLACVADTDLTLPLLREALGAELGGAPLLEALAELERRDLLACCGESYRFVHGIVRETLHARLGAGEQGRLHAQLDVARGTLRSRPTRRLAPGGAWHARAHA